jgi:hypothetical protein
MIAARDQKIPIDETDYHQAQRESNENSPNQVRTMMGNGFGRPEAGRFNGFHAAVQEPSRSVLPIARGDPRVSEIQTSAFFIGRSYTNVLLSFESSESRRREDISPTR